MTELTRVDVCVCTFRRAFLSETLRSVAANARAGIALRVIVADNDTIPSAQSLTEAFAAQVDFPVLYHHVPAANISLARNACLEAASAEFVAFIDDDEHAAPQWLAAMLQSAHATGADAVLGPVVAEFGLDAPAWIRKGDFHSTLPAYVNGDIKTGYTCNVLMRRREPFSSLRFDLSLGQSGGEDTEYFYRLRDLGGRLAFAPDAVIYEPVHAERACFKWLIRRRFRSGQTYGLRLLHTSQGGCWGIALAGVKAGFCFLIAVLSIASPVGWRRHFLRGTMHAGVVGGLLRTPQARLYGHGASPQEGALHNHDHEPNGVPQSARGS